jgi:hypothetical protein
LASSREGIDKTLIQKTGTRTSHVTLDIQKPHSLSQLKIFNAKKRKWDTLNYIAGTGYCFRRPPSAIPIFPQVSYLTSLYFSCRILSSLRFSRSFIISRSIAALAVSIYNKIILYNFVYFWF